MDENLVEYQQMLKAADAQMTKEIEDMTNGKYVIKSLNTSRIDYVHEYFEYTYQQRVGIFPI